MVYTKSHFNWSRPKTAQTTTAVERELLTKEQSRETKLGLIAQLN